MEWHARKKTTKQNLLVLVVGASGDLAKKKTYPALLDLWSRNLLPTGLVVFGFARAVLSGGAEFRNHLRYAWIFAVVFSPYCTVLLLPDLDMCTRTPHAQGCGARLGWVAVQRGARSRGH
jgi:Glucose-6-phosphate dehydrogenase, NAD binding domain